MGLGYGLVVARRAGAESPAPRPVGAVLAAAVVLAAACAIPLRNIANVRPEITRVVATEERTAATYQAASDAFRKGRISAEALAQLAERKILPELQAVEARLTALKNVPSEHQPLVTDAREYLRLRSQAWRARADAIRKTNMDPLAGVGAIHGRKLAHSGTGAVQIEPGGDGECGRRRASVAAKRFSASRAPRRPPLPCSRRRADAPAPPHAPYPPYLPYLPSPALLQLSQIREQRRAFLWPRLPIEIHAVRGGDRRRDRRVTQPHSP